MKRVYTFGNGKAEGSADMKNLLGGKGANLAEMNLIGVPVPPGFTITTEVCTEYNEKGKDAIVKIIKEDVENSIKHRRARHPFGQREQPLQSLLCDGRLYLHFRGRHMAECLPRVLFVRTHLFGSLES